MLETIEKNGEFESYVEMLAEREDRERKELRKRKRERDALADGDALISEEEDQDEEEDGNSDWSNSEESQADSENCMSDFNAVSPGPRNGTPSQSMYGQSRKHRQALSKASNLEELAMRFNALRFLAMNLKSQNDSLRK